MTNIITALTFITLATNWHGVENANYEVQIITKTTHLQYGTNTFVLNTETEIGSERLRMRIPERIMFITNSWGIIPIYWVTNDNSIWGNEIITTNDCWINRKLEEK